MQAELRISRARAGSRAIYFLLVIFPPLFLFLFPPAAFFFFTIEWQTSKFKYAHGHDLGRSTVYDAIERKNAIGGRGQRRARVNYECRCSR